MHHRHNHHKETLIKFVSYYCLNNILVTTTRTCPNRKPSSVVPQVISFSRYTFPLQCMKRYLSGKILSFSCYRAFILFFFILSIYLPSAMLEKIIVSKIFIFLIVLLILLFSQYTIPLQCSKRYFYLSEVTMVLTYQPFIYNVVTKFSLRSKDTS